MLNPGPIADAIVAALLNISALSTAMEGRISAFHYLLGADHHLAEAVYKLPAPSMLVAFEGTQGGNFNGYQMWKHKFGIYIRMGNAAGVGSPVGYEQIWYLITNGIPTGSPVNIRYMTLVTGVDIPDTPSIAHIMDEDQIDMFKVTLVIPEIQDN